MRAAVLKRYGARMIIENRDLPKLQPDEVLLKMMYSPVNPSDLYFLKGVYGDKKPLPIVGGFEGKRSLNRCWYHRRLRKH